MSTGFGMTGSPLRSFEPPDRVETKEREMDDYSKTALII